MSIKINKIVNELNSSSTNQSSTTTKKSLIQRNRVLDQHARDRRRKQQLAQLERDNFHDDPHANLVMHKKAPKFDDTITNQSTNSSNRKSLTSTFKLKSLTLSNLIEDDLKLNPFVNYSNASAPALDAMYIGNSELRRKQYVQWLLQTDKEPDENELDENSDENELMEIDSDDKKTNNKKNRSANNYFKELEDDSNSYKRILIVTKRNFCCVCGFKAPYTCVVCGMRYCCSSCLTTHKDTRCLKFTA